MIPRASILGNDTNDPEISNEVSVSWIDTHPGDDIEQRIREYILQRYEEEFSDIIVEQGRIIYLRWMAQHRIGLTVVMAAIDNDFFKIGLDTYNWSRFVSNYVSCNPNRDNIKEIVEIDHRDTTIEKIPKEIHREWFNIAITGGTFILATDIWDYHYNVANIVGYFPWIIYFADKGNVTSETFTLDVSISADFDLDSEEIFDHIDGDLDEQFWLLIYQFVLQLGTIAEENRGDTWYRYLQAVHEFTTPRKNYQKHLKNIFNYRDLLHIIDFDYLRSYVHELLTNIADQPSSAEICHTLLEFADLLLDMEFTDLAKLSEATTLEHALQLEQSSDLILALTHRSAKWGNSHLISFIQTLVGLLPKDDNGKSLLSEAINLVTDKLQQSWDGMLCIVEGKLIADRIGDAISLRFDATNQVGDRYNKVEDIFAALTWALQFDFDADKLKDISEPYLDYAFGNLDDAMLVDQTDILIQTAVNHNRITYLRCYLQYLKDHLGLIDVAYHRTLLDNINQILTGSTDYIIHRIEILLIRLHSLMFSEDNDPDRPFQLVSQIYNSINPKLSADAQFMRYIGQTLIKFAAEIDEWPLIDEVRRRYLLLARDEKQARTHLRSIFFKTSLDRAKLPTNKLDHNDIGIQIFNEGLDLSDLKQDYKVIAKILPQIKRLAIKSRSYSELTNLILIDIKLKKLHEQPWIEQLLKDIEIIIDRGSILDVNMVFSSLFSDLDLNKNERQAILVAQLELAEVEPDLLTADEIYTKRMELAELVGTEQTHQEFMVDNYQHGISELMSKGDTKNLTNLLFDAIAFSLQHDIPQLAEFKVVLLDNFENVMQDFRSNISVESYQYLLTFWRQIIQKFASTDFTIIVESGTKLMSLNLKLYDYSSNNQYLRRCQLVEKEMALVAKQHQVKLDEELELLLLQLHDQLVGALINQHQDFGIFAAVFQSALFYYHFNKITLVYPLLDQAISKMKREIISDTAAHSSVFLLFLQLSELSVILEADFNDDIMNELIDRVKRVISFALSLNLSKNIRNKLHDLQRSVNQSPGSFFHEFPFSIGQYLDDSIAL